MNINKFKITDVNKFNFKSFDPDATQLTMDKPAVLETGKINIKKMQILQDRFYAEGKEAILIVLQAMDAAGKDGAIKHVMTGVNPQGVEVSNFKKPSSLESSHDYLWRCIKELPPRGKIGIFNRSYYEDVLVNKVHSLYKTQNLPERCKKDDIFEKRYNQIKNFEEYLWENGTRIIKFFFCISKDEQKKRFLKRITDKNKNWKLSDSDVVERKYWDDYMQAYELAINSTATQFAPWYVIPSNKKWFARYLVSEIIVNAMEEINPKYPKVGKDKEKMILKCKDILKNEK